MSAKPKGSYAVMAERVSAPDALDDFPTPPWATRALLVHVLPRLAPPEPYRLWTVWEPACGRGTMSMVLAEKFANVYPSDVHDYGAAPFAEVGSFVGEGCDKIVPPPNGVDWIITNPPFKLALEFAERALAEARVGVALLCRLAFMETAARHKLFERDPYFAVCPFVERVPMVEGRWDQDASTATAYAWFVWTRPACPGRAPVVWPIPPGCRKSLTLIDDVARFAACVDQT